MSIIIKHNPLPPSHKYNRISRIDGIEEMIFTRLHLKSNLYPLYPAYPIFQFIITYNKTNNTTRNKTHNFEIKLF